ncbi:MAG: RHS repeat-associated core domain-containing protein, partial [Planctomycetes bacterium]|nr:RHS repeat-associated core domain-containing protein [Planctomycetota bacterium]
DATRYLFTGREFDSELEIHFFRARYYVGSIGRFGSEDPIRSVGEDTNYYRYVLNQPTALNDPSGLRTGVRPPIRRPPRGRPPIRDLPPPRQQFPVPPLPVPSPINKTPAGLTLDVFGELLQGCEQIQRTRTQQERTRGPGNAFDGPVFAPAEGPIGPAINLGPHVDDPTFNRVRLPGGKIIFVPRF